MVFKVNLFLFVINNFNLLNEFFFSGTIDEDTYQNLLKIQRLGTNTPIDFPGYNVQGNIFPFWSSEPYTYSVSLFALSQFNNLSD